ncbi:MAG: hypothetical protein MPK30_04570 [Gammaproteobacteria bacterium]|nr:hypothetical protein [Gammaproteobacteria bacterium]
MDIIRTELIDEVRRFFVGPSSPGETLPPGNLPRDMYTAGVLFPTNATQDEDEKDGKDEGDSDAEDQNADGQSNPIFKQNSIGLRVKLREGTKKIGLTIDYGKYVHKDGKWIRRMLDSGQRKHELDLAKRHGGFYIVSGDHNEARVWWKLYEENTLNIFLENIIPWIKPDDTGEKIDFSEKTIQNNQNCIFQPRIDLAAIDASDPFIPISSSNEIHTSAEEDQFNMLYRNKKNFGSGYGCAAEWDSDNKPSFVRSTIIPVFESKIIEKFSEMDNDYPSKIDMYELGCFDDLYDHESNRKKIRAELSPLINKYKKWINIQKSMIKTKLANTTHVKIAEKNIAECTNVLERITNGLKTLTDDTNMDDNILVAFILANRAMLYQRLHFAYSLRRSKNPKEKLEWPHAKKAGQEFWYPFQIAFILMSINGIASRTHKDADVADLIWFPTGGGKTEAYLGVAAFTMMLRRLRCKVEDGLGVSVIMRYTLRLLTLQQFERASTLMCAMEFLRRDPKIKGLGDDSFLIGLWVGRKLTPNHHDDSKQALQMLAYNEEASTPRGSPWQTYYCPWCGHRVGPRNYRYDEKSTKWTLLRCTNDKSPCPFTDRNFSPNKILPLVTVDSDVYTRCPSMIVATVDKFARMPFKDSVANIFGRPRKRCELHGFRHTEKINCNSEERHTSLGGKKISDVLDAFPPDLIIQDELHLITGPLGTMVGLYETAVDFLTRDRHGKRLKVIAATATAKGSSDQIRRIFNIKKTQVFPPPGINYDDSFFWWENADKPGRAFIGVSFSDKSVKFALAKLYGILLQKPQIDLDSKKITKEMLDPYWTVIGYYNSIRELGGSNRLVEDDVENNMGFIAKVIYKNSKKRDLGMPGAGIEELTGRKTQKEINMIRDKLEKSLESNDAISILLATNMISVGIDIDRLALMTIVGQPKSITEYIQTSGRIGRRDNSPGCVFVLLNPYKARDLSHYENFNGFHTSMQKQIELTTLSPFSISACNRGLHSVLIAMIRLTKKTLSAKMAAGNFTIENGREATEFILDRYKSIEQVDEDSNAYGNFRDQLRVIQEEWAKFIKKHGDVYYDKRDGDPSLMVGFSSQAYQSRDEFPLSTPDSLRDVEQQIKTEYVK